MINHDASELLTLAEAMRLLEAEEVAEEIAKVQTETRFCPTPMELDKFAGMGWRQEWALEGHAEWCRYCRAAARVGFSYNCPESWILDEPSNPDRPLWWQRAAEDYIEKEAPFQLRVLAALRVWLKGNPAGSAEPSLARGPKGEIRETILGYFDEKADLDTKLFRETSEGVPASYVLQVDDADGRRQPRTVRSGVATPIGHLLRDVQMDFRNGVLIGEVRIEEREIRAIGGPRGICPIPAVELRSNDGDPELDE